MDGLWFYTIRIEGHLGAQWADWFEGLEIRPEPNGETVLSGALPDQAALCSVINQIHALNLTLIEVTRVSKGTDRAMTHHELPQIV